MDMIGYMGRAKDIEKTKEGCKEAARKAEEAAGKANAASKTADTAAGKANSAAQNADAAAGKANSAAQNADAAAGKANTAAQNADTAAAEAKRIADTVNIKADLLNIILDGYLAEEPAAEITEGYYWCMPDGVSLNGYIVKSGEEAAGGDTCCAKLEVSPGEIYRITTINDGLYYTQAMHAVVIATAELAAGGYELISNEYAPTKEGGNEYILTVPEGADHLLVNTFSHNPDDIKIQNIRSTKASGIMLLWSGLLKSIDGGPSVSFSIPESCFFNNGKELVLMFNGYCPTETHGMYDMCIAGMCFGTAEDFGLGDTGGPMYKGEFTRYAYREEYSTISQAAHNMRIEAFVKKVTDIRYATCSVTNRSDCFYLTSVSAIIPA